MVVIFSRHGVRSPTWPQARLNAYSAQPWPVWSVPPGNLTPRGYELLKKFGSFDRDWLVSARLLSASGCTDASSIYIWADTDQRTIESGHALAEGLLPGCQVPLRGLPEGEDDPLFHPGMSAVSADQADQAFTALSARLQQPEDPEIGDLVQAMRHLLQGCPLETQCAPVFSPKALFPAAAPAALHGNGEHLVDLDGPLPVASSLAEDLLLEYADGLPMAQVGWGKVDEAKLRRLLKLHTEYFDLIHRTPVIAQNEASNLLFHIARTLEQGAEEKPVDGAIGPVGAKAVLLVGHDTNLAALASLLGVHWQLDGRKDDTPPGTAMAFELWQDAHGAYSVRISVAMQTLRQLRELSDLTVAAPPASTVITLPGAATMKNGTPLPKFERIASSVIIKRTVSPMNGQ